MAKLWGKTNAGDELILQYYDSGRDAWIFVEVVNTSNASRICRSTAKKTGIRHRVWNTGTNSLYCES